MKLKELVKDQNADKIVEWIQKTPTKEIAHEVAKLDSSQRFFPIHVLDQQKACEIFRYLNPIVQLDVLEGLSTEEAINIVKQMEPDDRAHLVEGVSYKVGARIMSGLSPEERESTESLLRYPDKSAGRSMTPKFVSLHDTMNVKEALDELRLSGQSVETVYTLPVLGGDDRVLGVVSLRKLVLSAPEELVVDLMKTEVTAVHADEDREVAARLLQSAALLAIPVLDGDERLVGIITVDDAMEILEDEETEDRALAGASSPLGRPYFSSSVFRIARSRATWLLILIGAATLTVNVLQIFEATLQQVATLALFIPLLIGTGGNTGAQASTVVIRAMAVGEIRFADLPRVLWRESRVGFMLGIMLAGVGYIPVAFIFGGDIAFIVAFTLVSICIWATFAGSMLPILARKVGVDPAVVSAPMVTTLVDTTGLLIYFTIARIVLGL